MITAARFLVAGLLLVGVSLGTGCRTARNVAVTSFRVLDAPARYIRERIEDSEEPAPVIATGPGGTSDVVTPGRPLNTPPPRPVITQRRTTSTDRPVSASTPRPQRKPSVAASPRPTAPLTQFPVAKPVPGRPGYVFSIDPKGGIVDVTGYKSGDKAKDPYTQQIFIVP